MSAFERSLLSTTDGDRLQRRALAVLAGALVLTTGNSAVAAGRDQRQSDERSLEEVVVTATKRESNLQDTALSLSALTGADLAAVGATGAQDYLSEVPGVHYGALGRGRSVIVMRGVSTEASNLSNLQNTVETYIDELPTLNRWSAWTNADPQMVDIERVEVLRGPQGTLFGSGALGGAVRIITNKPDYSEFSASTEVGIASTKGGDETTNVSGVLNIPLVKDQLALRGVAYARDDGGFVNNIRRGQENVDGGHTEGGRLMLGYTPIEPLNLRLTITREDNVVDDSPKVFSTRAQGKSDEWDGVLPERSDINLTVFNLVGEYDFKNATLTSSSTYAERDQFLVTDFVSILAPIANTGMDPNQNDAWIQHDTKTIAQELRLASNGGGKLDWTVGAFFMKQDIDARQVFNLGNPRVLLLDAFIVADSDERALFGEATYHLTDKFAVTAGARWFDNSFEIANSPGAFGPGLLNGPPVPPTETTSSDVTPKVSVSFYPAERVHLYASATQGYRVGQTNFNAGLDPVIPDGFGPDTLWNYEVGAKSTWLENRLRVNAAAFYIDWSNIQLTRYETLANGVSWNFTDNGGNAVVKGAEAEIALRASRNWEFGTSLSYVHARLKSVIEGVPLVPDSTLPGSPEFSASSFAEFVTDFPHDISGYLRLSHRYVGEVLSDINNSDLTTSDSYNVFDLRAGVQMGQYEVVLYADNVADSDALVARQFVASAVPYGYRLRPRTIGLTFRAAF